MLPSWLTTFTTLTNVKVLDTPRENLRLLITAPNERLMNLEHGEIGSPFPHLDPTLPDRTPLWILYNQAMGLHFVIEARLFGWHALDTMGKEIALDLSGYQRRHQPQRLGGDKPLSAFFIQADLFCHDVANGTFELALQGFPGCPIDMGDLAAQRFGDAGPVSLADNFPDHPGALRMPTDGVHHQSKQLRLASQPLEPGIAYHLLAQERVGHSMQEVVSPLDVANAILVGNRALPQAPPSARFQVYIDVDNDLGDIVQQASIDDRHTPQLPGRGLLFWGLLRREQVLSSESETKHAGLEAVIQHSARVAMVMGFRGRQQLDTLGVALQRLLDVGLEHRRCQRGAFLDRPDQLLPIGCCQQLRTGARVLPTGIILDAVADGRVAAPA